MFPISVKGVVFTEDAKVVLLLNDRGEWELPGGRIEVGESPEECLAREFAEELSVAVDILAPLDSYFFEVVPDKHVFIVTYGCKLRNCFVPVISQEHKEVGVFLVSELPPNLPKNYCDSILSWHQRAWLVWNMNLSLKEGNSFMSDPQVSYPYVTHLNKFYEALEVVDLPALVGACNDRWYNQTLCQVNDSVVRLGVVQGEYHWHKHDDEDEFFYVVSGTFIIDLEGRSIELAPSQGFVVPKGVMHRPRAPERTVILMVESAGIVPTGDA